MLITIIFGGVISIKKYEKFRSYKTVFAIFFITVLLSSVVGAVVCRRYFAAHSVFEILCSAYDNISSAILIELIFFLWVFAAGPTIYAPTSSFLAILIYGMLFGARLTECHALPLYAIAVEILFSVATAYIFVVFSSFVTLTGLRIFTDNKSNKKRELFDGVLFRAEGFKGIYNIRYILSYILFFLIFLTSAMAFSAVKVFLLSL